MLKQPARELGKVEHGIYAECMRLYTMSESNNYLKAEAREMEERTTGRDKRSFHQAGASCRSHK